MGGSSRSPLGETSTRGRDDARKSHPPGQSAHSAIATRRLGCAREFVRLAARMKTVGSFRAMYVAAFLLGSLLALLIAAPSRGAEPAIPAAVPRVSPAVFE
jgi:hypothetical protein